MGVRELINKHQGLAIGVAAVLILLCLFWITRNASPTQASVATQAYYTDDDGKTFFTDDAVKVVPFQHNGKEAVKAFVYDCKGTRSVHYMQRYTPVGVKAAQEWLTKSGGKEVSIPDELNATGIEFKRPGDATWQPNPPGPKPCPDGGRPEWVNP